MNKIELREIVKKFLKNTFKYCLIFRELKDSEKQIISTFSSISSVVTKNKSFQLSLTFNKHIKNNNLVFDDSFVTCFHIDDIC